MSGDYTLVAEETVKVLLFSVPVPRGGSPAGGARRPSFLDYDPVPLQFGTSGLRGLVKDITDLEAYINSKGFFRYLFKIGDVRRGRLITIAGDLRTSTDRILKAVVRAAHDMGLKTEYLGKIPTPALTYYAMQNGRASVMVTGSHIPFDRNGIKFNKSAGEVLKGDESGILAEVAKVRAEEYGRDPRKVIFDRTGMLKKRYAPELPPINRAGENLYKSRYRDFFGEALKGLRVVMYQHSAVGRDILVEILRSAGAEVFPAGRSEKFIPIDTENITDEQLDRLESLLGGTLADEGIDAIVSTDGDSDRPLVAAVLRPEDRREGEKRVRFFAGDLLGIVVAEYLDSDAAVVTVSANDAVDRQLNGRLRPKTKIGSPYVIQAMEEAKASGEFRRVVGWEANGGFLTATDIQKGGRVLKALPTRDSALPILAALSSAAGEHISLAERFERLPPRYSKAGLLDNVPVASSRKILMRISPGEGIHTVEFNDGRIILSVSDGRRRELDLKSEEAMPLLEKKLAIESVFTATQGFDAVSKLNAVDGLRIYFRNGDIAHVRPSGNAPQLRIYANSDTSARAEEIVRLGLQEPDGLLRQLERM